MPDMSEPEFESSDLVRQLRAIGRLEPSAAAVYRVRLALNRATIAEPATRTSRGFSWRRPTIALAIALALLTLATASALASGDALPDSPFYAVRGLREGLQLQLASGPGQRAVLYATFAASRSSQLKKLTSEHRAAANVVRTLLHDISDQVQHANQEAQNDGQSARTAVQQAQSQIGEQLNQLKQDEAISGQDGATLSDTLRSVESGQPNQSGGSGGNENAPGTGDGEGVNQP